MFYEKELEKQNEELKTKLARLEGRTVEWHPYRNKVMMTLTHNTESWVLKYGRVVIAKIHHDSNDVWTYDIEGERSDAWIFGRQKVTTLEDAKQAVEKEIFEGNMSNDTN